MTKAQPEADMGVENLAALEGAENELSRGMCWGVWVLLAPPSAGNYPPFSYLSSMLKHFDSTLGSLLTKLP